MLTRRQMLKEIFKGTKLMGLVAIAPIATLNQLSITTDKYGTWFGNVKHSPKNENNEFMHNTMIWDKNVKVPTIIFHGESKVHNVTFRVPANTAIENHSSIQLELMLNDRTQ